jgi:prepilin-type N-terminal cleavage/methylation domain-containing protein
MEVRAGRIRNRVHKRGETTLTSTTEKLCHREESDPPNPGAGFTLVELVYVLLIVALLAGLAIPRIDVARFRMDTTVNEVATTLMAAQRAAVLRGHDMVVSFDETNRWLMIHVDANNDGLIQSGENRKVVELGEGVSFGLQAAPQIRNGTVPFDFQARRGGQPIMTFHRNGSASEMGILYLTSLGGGGSRAENARAVEVIRSTGRVKCWSYKTGEWKETC